MCSRSCAVVFPSWGSSLPSVGCQSGSSRPDVGEEGQRSSASDQEDRAREHNPQKEHTTPGGDELPHFFRCISWNLRGAADWDLLQQDFGTWDVLALQEASGSLAPPHPCSQAPGVFRHILLVAHSRRARRIVRWTTGPGHFPPVTLRWRPEHLIQFTSVYMPHIGMSQADRAKYYQMLQSTAGQGVENQKLADGDGGL